MHPEEISTCSLHHILTVFVTYRVFVGGTGQLLAEDEGDDFLATLLYLLKGQIMAFPYTFTIWAL
ncbi:hypothetical protein CFAL_08275 [Corynebacterium falsenii DSM 44353]|nr:hypothetical protein CFAL_08275 [Corynebacterium falsenii DSM 44353]